MNYYEDNGWESEFRHHMPDTLPLVEWADKFNMENYVSIFEKTHPNTLIWQVIAVVIIIWFRKELMELVHALIKKIPELKSFGRTEFELPAKVQKNIDEKSEKLDKVLKAHKKIVAENPNFVFLAIFIEIEHLLSKLYFLVYSDQDNNLRRISPRMIFNRLVRRRVISDTLFRTFVGYQAIRNQIIHEQELLYTHDEIKNFSKGLLLFKDEIADVVEKYKKRQLGDPLPGKARQLGDRL